MYPLIGIGKASHSRHDAQHVVVNCIHAHQGRGLRRILRARNGVACGLAVNVRAECRGSERQVQHGVVNAGEVARARRLQVLGLQGEGVHVDTLRRGGRVVLVGLHGVEVLALTLHKPIMAVELDLGHSHGVAEVGVRVAPRGVGLGVAVKVAGVLHNPDELLHGVVEGHLDLVGGGGHGLLTGELQLLDQVLVGHLGEAAALLSVQVDVVHEQRAGDQAVAVQEVHIRAAGVAQVLELVELDVDLHLVVLEGDQGEGQAGVAIEPELQRDVQGLLRNAAVKCITIIDSIIRSTEASHTRLEEAVITARGQGGVHAGQGLGHTQGRLRGAGVAVRDINLLDVNTTIAVHHVQVLAALAGGQGQLIPDVEPVTIVLIDALATDLNLNGLDQELTYVRDPGEVAGAVGRHIGEVDLGESGLQVDLVDQITVTGDRACHALAEVGHTVEGLLNSLHREVGVAAVELLEEGYLGIGRQVHVLGAVGDELHEATGGHCLYSCF